MLSVPSPKSLLIATSLLNENAYDKDIIFNLIALNTKELLQSYIPMCQLNLLKDTNKSFALQLINTKDNNVKVYPELYAKDTWTKTNSNWSDLICLNVYTLAIDNNKFFSTLATKEKHEIVTNARVKILWSRIIPNSNLNTINIEESTIKLIKASQNQIETSNQILSELYYPVEITYKDFYLMRLAVQKKLNILSNNKIFIKELKDSIVFTEEEKLKLEDMNKSSSFNNKDILELVDDKSITPFLMTKFGLINDYTVDDKNISLVIHEICSGSSLNIILNNFSQESYKIGNYIQNNTHILEKIWPKIWNKFTDKVNNQEHSFLITPERIFTVLNKLGLNTSKLLEIDKDNDFYLSHFLLNKANDGIMDCLIEKGFYTKEWFINELSENHWNNLIQNKNSSLFYTLRNHLKVSVFDIAPSKYHSQLFKVLIDTGSDFDIQFAMESSSFNIKIIDENIKVSNKVGTYLHKLLTKGFEKSFLYALAQDANYKIPEGNDILTFMAGKAKYTQLLKQLTPLLLYNELQKELKPKNYETKQKKKI